MAYYLFTYSLFSKKSPKTPNGLQNDILQCKDVKATSVFPKEIVGNEVFWGEMQACVKMLK